MPTGLTVYESARMIPNAFMDSGTAPDGTDNVGAYIDCTIKVSGSSPQGKCTGISIGAVSDSETLGAIKVKHRGDNNIVTIKRALGITHPMSVERLYTGTNANDVVIHW